jgi:hypothetical protein
MRGAQICIYFAMAAGACLSNSAVRAVPFPGPDNFGYFAKSIPFHLRDVRDTGSDLGLDATDDSVAVVPIGFSFPFYGINYTEVRVSDNGFLSFKTTGDAACCSGQPIPTTGGPLDNFVAGWWEDLAPNKGGVIRSQTVGSIGSREFVVGYYDVADFDDPVNSINTMELVLHEGTGDIELQLAQIQFDNVDDKVVGIENQDGSDGIEILFLPSSEPGLENGDLVFEKQGFLISLVPEPSSLLLAIGVVTCLCPSRFRRVR